MAQVVIPNLQKNTWTSNIGPDINKAESVVFEGFNAPSGQLLVGNVGTVKDAGGLVSHHLIVPKNGAVFYPYAQLTVRLSVPSLLAYNLSRLETDFLAVFTAAPTSSPGSTTSIKNKGNCSTQFNATTGHFEIDASAGSAAWSDIGGGPGSIAPDQEHVLVIKCAFDLARAMRSVCSITWDGTVYAVPAKLQEVVFQSSNWAQVASIQLQNEMVSPGATAVIYSSIELAWSDQPF